MKTLGNARKLIFDILRYYKNYFIRPIIPKIIFIESTNACNYRCVMCARNKMRRKIGFMEFDLYKKIIDQLSNSNIKNVALQFYGEPLLHKKIVSFIEYAKTKEIYVSFDTNAELLTEQMAEQLIISGLDSITFSVHGLNPEDYRGIYEKDSFRLVKNNIETFHKIRLKLHKKTPRLVLQTAIMERNYKNIAAGISSFEPYIDGFSITNGYYHPMTMTHDCRLIKFDYKRRYSPCNSLFDMLAISYDGLVTVCCADVNFELQIGHIDQGIVNLFNKSKKLNQYRKCHLYGKFEKMPLCLNCMDSVTNYIPKKTRQKIIGRGDYPLP